MKTGGFGDWEWSKIDSVWKSWRERRKREKRQTGWQCYEMLFREETSCFLFQQSFALWISAWPWTNLCVPLFNLCTQNNIQSLSAFRHKYAASNMVFLMRIYDTCSQQDFFFYSCMCFTPHWHVKESSLYWFNTKREIRSMNLLRILFKHSRDVNSLPCILWMIPYWSLWLEKTVLCPGGPITLKPRT